MPRHGIAIDSSGNGMRLRNADIANSDLGG
jgi:hypothetical protein